MRMNRVAIAASAVIGLGLMFDTQGATANSIGLVVAGGGSPATGEVLSTTSIGVTGLYQQTHWNNVDNNQVVSTGLKEAWTPLGDSGAGGSVAAGGPYVDSTGAAVSGLVVNWAGSGNADSWTHPFSPVGYLAVPSNTGPAAAGAALDNNLYDGYLYIGGANNTSVQVQNIPYSSYSIVVYAASSPQSVADVSTENNVTSFDATTGLPVGTSVAQGTFQTVASSTWTAASGTTAGNYFVVSGLTGSDQTITFSNTVGGEFEIEGLQIVDTSAVPEPASLSLLGIGGLALLRRRRRA